MTPPTTIAAESLRRTNDVTAVYPPTDFSSSWSAALPASSRSVQSAAIKYAQQPYGSMATTVQNKRKKAKEVTSVGGSTAIARSLMMQGLYLFYRTPVKVCRFLYILYLQLSLPVGNQLIYDLYTKKLFRPLRIDYLMMARALLPPVDEASTKRFSFRYTSIGMISHAVKKQGWNFIPRHILPPLLANTMIGTVLYTTYIASLPMFHPASSFQLHRPFPPPPFSSVFMAGCLAGAMQSIVAAPLDSVKIRFEVSDLMEGKHRSMYQFAKSTLKELGIASAYRGFSLTLVRDSLSCGLFFATFEWVKQQGYYYFLDEMYGLQVDSRKTLHQLEGMHRHHGEKDISHSISTEKSANPSNIATKERPPLMLEPIFVILAGAAAAVAYQIIEHPLSKIHSIFYIEEGQSEFTHKDKRESVRVLYRKTWEQCKLQVRMHGGSWRKFMYQEFGSTVIKVVPATSIGFLVFELVKREVDFRSIAAFEEEYETLDPSHP
ncbi:mitochondrial carrier domain-containing protein [Zychaea mexicana]|uniref:mitochondrial carrier domain-containing protein n=1 Tax=Zychaea mexicana TaxID=64656 RepID=UPI0022FE852E|nr:mitochondrial carrier domain-containing protein [Zychaea mexicana]KAI9492997.1 mitochondrial carrier domain-containing protein [Zychaea mexicana]